ncbi:hypothetical protein P4N68_02085 [Corynebacterium felinum]|uniref:Uncharacterized protein YjbI with pentapeptide repeats n=1 Tax=Corynebacterium felinum TaxID=131318 RepID=A0ABU2BCB0_9CORY|nr:pentapeptide repeat-containing protein [Corynebacterium felinum]MDF5819871.1 hypothetical protein [Corynebacterium felinum]MDR7355986.1 uncharacterized protein YjbI with pentapeptide repeats [Corynebacterium felinum]WJY95322.1 hypothetical protein CFELI_08585 [Corynebacterium felinum]
MGKDLEKITVIYLYKKKKTTAESGQKNMFREIVSLRPKSLLLDISRWVFFALFIFTLIGSIYAPKEENWGLLKRFIAIWLIRSQDKPLDIVTVVLTLVGAIGAIAYFVIRFRERTDQETELLVKEKAAIEDRFDKAIEQLGDPSPQVRIAGVYALTDIADTYLGHYQQRTVDILCGYLRINRVDENGKFNDAAVESTILNVLREHLLSDKNEKIDENVQVKNDEQLWTNCIIDLHGAVINERFSFANCTFNSCNFNRTLFRQKVTCKKSDFISQANFDEACFIGNASFEEAKFWGEVSFKGAKFVNGTSFAKVSFVKRCTFNGMVNQGAVTFTNSVFGDVANFNDSKFNHSLVFRNAIFRNRCSFAGLLVEGWSSFIEIAFHGGVSFAGTTFVGESSFRKSIFHRPATFDAVTFVGEATFREVKFVKKASFVEVSFLGEVSFNESMFQGETIFNKGSFWSWASFSGVNFQNYVSFEGAAFESRCFL